MDLLQILQSQLSPQLVNNLSQEIGATPQQTQAAAADIFSTLLSGMARNASDQNGLSALVGALDRNHDGSVLDDLMGMAMQVMQGQGQGATNGQGIIRHILGDQAPSAAQQISQNSGLNAGQVMKLMPILAPIVMSVLGKARKQGGLDMSQIAMLLMQMQGGGQAQRGGAGGLLGGLLGSLLGGGQQRQAPQNQQGADLLGNVLGSLFGKK